ncbi:MAG: DUF4411 family protein [Sulfuricellaceae bacterium]|nr:DUF4411 family protein [Sulfuricellaceae bacterium]
MNYLLDANTFIEAKNRYYNMVVCPGYWDWIELEFADGEVASVESVGDELLSGNDELKTWAASHKPLFLPVSDEETQVAFAEIAAHAVDLAAEMKPGALEEFLGGADPWLIAKARVQGSVVVTHEQFNPQRQKENPDSQRMQTVRCALDEHVRIVAGVGGEVCAGRLATGQGLHSIWSCETDRCC